MSREQRTGIKTKKNCFDCLHCKVSAKSTEDDFLCFCAKSKKRVAHKKPFWLKKSLCKRFDDMSA